MEMGSASDQEMRINFACLAFADDLVLVAPSVEKLQNLVNILADHCQKYRMSVNVDKTKTMVFRKNYQTRREDISVKYGHQTLEQVRNYKYLGIIFDECLNFGLAVDELSHSASRALGSVLNKCRTHRNTAYKSYCKMIEACVNPITDYCGEVLGHETQKRMEDIQYQACRSFLGVSKFTPLPCLNAEMGWLPTKYRRHKSVLRFYNQLLKMDDNRIPQRIFLKSVNNDRSWAGRTRVLMESVGLGIYWNMGIQIPNDLLHFYPKEKYKEEFHASVEAKAKLRTYNKIKSTTEVSSYVRANVPKPMRSLSAQLCCGVLKIRLETGRYNNEDLNERQCVLCDSGAIEDKMHFLFDCDAYSDERDKFSLPEPVLADHLHLKKLYEQPFVFGKYLQMLWNRRNILLSS